MASIHEQGEKERNGTKEDLQEKTPRKDQLRKKGEKEIKGEEGRQDNEKNEKDNDQEIRRKEELNEQIKRGSITSIDEKIKKDGDEIHESKETPKKQSEQKKTSKNKDQKGILNGLRNQMNSIVRSEYIEKAKNF